MTTASETARHSLRLSAEDLKNRLASGEPVTILDARGSKAWESSGEKIRGAIRRSPENFQVDPSWPHDRLTVVY